MGLLRQVLRRFVRDPNAFAKLVWKNLVYPFTPHAANARWDRKWSVHTGGIVEDSPDALTDSACYAVAYVPAPVKVVEHLVATAIGLYGDASRFSFVDFGSGKGRVMLIAARHHFQDVIGVDFSPSLCNVARLNLATARQHAREPLAPTQVVCSDALNFVLPDTPCMIWFFNPFHGPVMRGVIQNIVTSYKRSPRDIVVIYFYPTQGHMLDDANFETVMTIENLPKDRTNYSTKIHMTATIYRARSDTSNG